MPRLSLDVFIDITPRRSLSLMPCRRRYVYAIIRHYAIATPLPLLRATLSFALLDDTPLRHAAHAAGAERRSLLSLLY